MGQPLMPPAPAELAASLRSRLEQLLPAVKGGRGRDLDFAAASLETAIGELGALLREISNGAAGMPEHSLRQEIESCRGLARQLTQLLEQAREIRLAHWTPAADGTYTACGSPAQAPRPSLVRRLG